MKYLKFYLLFLLVEFIFSKVSFGQDYEINYDLISQKTNIINLKNTKDTLHKKEFKLKPGSNIKFKITNFNPEALELERISKKSFVIDTLLMSSNQNAIFSFLQNKMVVPSLGKEFSGMLEGLTKSRGQGASPLKTNKLLINKEELSNIPNYNFEDLSILMNSRFQAYAKLKEADSDLKKLRLEFNSTEESIKTNASKVIDFLDIETKKLFKSDKNQMDVLERLKQIASENALMIELASEALNNAFNEGNVPKTRSSDSDFFHKIETKNFESLQQAAKELNQEKIIQELINFYQDYRIILEKKYSYTFVTTANYNTDLLNINFYKVNANNIGNKNQREFLKSETFKFKINELKVATNAGILFVNYFENPQSYGIYNGKISATELDKITPVISTMLNFGSTSSAPIKIGGNLGIGVAVNEKKSIHFFLGPSISIGRTNLINLNFGLSTSRITRLSEGLKVGDIYAAKVPTIDRYELGLYFGLTFNLAAIKK